MRLFNKAISALRTARCAWCALAALAFAASSYAATFNPSASKAYVDNQVSNLYSVIYERSVFTNTLQNVYNITTNTTVYATNYNYEISYKTNVFVDVNTVTNVFVTNMYANTYQTNNSYFVYNITTNTVQRNYTTNFYYSVNYRTNLTVDVTEVTNITTEVTYQTNVAVYVTNNVNIVTNDIVFTDTVWYTNDTYAIAGYTGVVIRATRYDGYWPAEFSTNAVTFAPRLCMAATYTNEEYELTLMPNNTGYYPSEKDMYYLYSNGNVQSNYSFAGDVPALGVAFSYEGPSLLKATKLTLPYFVGPSMTGDMLLILYSANVSDYEKNTRHVRYNETMAAGFSDESRRIVTPDGTSWIDATGVVWEVSGAYAAEAFAACGTFLFRVPTGDLPSEVERYSGGEWLLTFQHDDGEYSADGGTWTLSNVSDPETTPMTASGSMWPNLAFFTGEPDYALFSSAYPCTVYTNGVVRTNAVRRVVFSDDMSSATALTRFDGASVSTNIAGELEIYKFSSNGRTDTMPVTYYDNAAGEIRLQWKSVSEMSQVIADAISRNATWGLNGSSLNNCFIQVGRKVYPVGDVQGGSTISMANRPDGTYGVGVRYTPSGGAGGEGAYSIAFGLVETLEQSYESVVFVGTLTGSLSGNMQWYGIASIPIVMVFE